MIHVSAGDKSDSIREAVGRSAEEPLAITQPMTARADVEDVGSVRVQSFENGPMNDAAAIGKGMSGRRDCSARLRTSWTIPELKLGKILGQKCWLLGGDCRSLPSFIGFFPDVDLPRLRGLNEGALCFAYELCQ